MFKFFLHSKGQRLMEKNIRGRLSQTWEGRIHRINGPAFQWLLGKNESILLLHKSQIKESALAAWFQVQALDPGFD